MYSLPEILQPLKGLHSIEVLTVAAMKLLKNQDVCDFY
jgi:hypothetical protein